MTIQENDRTIIQKSDIMFSLWSRLRNEQMM